MMFMLAVALMTGMFLGITGYRLYLQRLHKTQLWIRTVQQGGRRGKR
jgi:hypothetical protein